MNDRIKEFKTEISKCLKKEDFNSLYHFFVTKNFSFKEFRIFYKRNEKTFGYPSFWVSQLPHFHLKEILESDMKVTFLQSYFKKQEHCNHELNKHLVMIAKDDYFKHFKLWKAFRFEDFLVSFKQLAQESADIARIEKELDIVIKAQKKIDEEEQKDMHYFTHFKFDEIALAFALYHHAFRQSTQNAGNKSLQTAVEVTLVNELNNLLKLLKDKSCLGFQYDSNDALPKELSSIEKIATRSIAGEVLNTHQLRLSQLIDRLIFRNSQRVAIQYYLCGYSDFEKVVLNPARLKTNSSFKTFRINEQKSICEEHYFFEVRKGVKPFRADVKPSLEVLKLYAIPETIKSKGKEIEVKKVLQLLMYFSVFKGPVEVFFNPFEKNFIINNKGDDQFIGLFGSNEALTLFDYNQLITGIINYFNWGEEESKAIFDFLSFDISEGNFPLHWLNSPFIKFNNQVLWLGYFLKDRRWYNILLNKFKKEVSGLDQEISKNLELKIEGLFKCKSFKTFRSNGKKFTTSEGQSGDFDVLAFKDNHLFVCEVKAGSRSNEPSHAQYFETVRLEGHAAWQLEKAIFRINEDWDYIRKELGVGEDVKLESVKLYPLIITDYFEGDLKLYKNSFRKISLLELDVILNNQKEKLLKLYLLTRASRDAQNPDLKKDVPVIENWDLWQGSKKLEVGAIIRNIEENAIWKEIESTWKFEDEAQEIDY